MSLCDFYHNVNICEVEIGDGVKLFSLVSVSFAAVEDTLLYFW